MKLSDEELSKSILSDDDCELVPVLSDDEPDHESDRRELSHKSNREDAREDVREFDRESDQKDARDPDDVIDDLIDELADGDDHGDNWADDDDWVEDAHIDDDLADDEVADEDAQLDRMMQELDEDFDQQDEQEEMPALRHKQLREERLKKLQRKKKAKRLVIPLVALLVACIGLVAFDYISSWGTIHRNVDIAGLDVSGKTADEARIYMNERLAYFAESPFSVQYVPELPSDVDADADGDEDDADANTDDASDNGDSNGDDDYGARSDYTWEMYAEEIGLSFDTTKAAQQAFDFGRSDDILQSLLDRLMSYFEEYQVDIPVDTDEERVEGVFSEIREITDIGYIDSSVALDDGTFAVETGSDGVALDEDELVARMAQAILTQNYEIEAPIGTAYRYIDDAEAQRAADWANQVASLAVDVNYDDLTWTFEPSDIVRIIDFKRSDQTEEDDAVVQSADSAFAAADTDDEGEQDEDDASDSDEYTEESTEHSLEVILPADEVREHFIGRLGTDVGRAPVNARFVVEGTRVTIRPSQTGSGVDAQQLAFDLAEVLTDMDEDNRSVEVTMREIEPRRTTADAEAMGIRERISTYTTNFSLGNANRLNNIQLISRMLDGIIVAPGEEFSFNGATGRRDVDDGFLAAGVIIGGEMSTAVGGGICQVSTTMFNATMLAGVQVTSRINHSTFLSNYSPGRDAAVARYGPDFRFRNTLDNYILISATTTNSTSTISFFSIDPGYDITIRTGDFRRTNFQTEEVRDNTLERGSREVERPGIRGGTVNVYYTVRDGDRIVRQQTFTSNYRNVNEIVRIGTMRASDSDDD